ncbi:hypothetical protein B0T18DRAFT_386852 [Schizothecium vesticola]|uniref:Uncharacterized protein n=1 Tax=Schizothecium vesticola TaxID=314040 RepID=A0AA40KDN0_9PEZI|nr:hypothetical protein B0T18DRAFT_386852 [Schizothecium vesticola]
MQSPPSRHLPPRLNPIIPTAHLICGHFTTTDHHDVGKLIDAMRPSIPSVYDDCFTPARTCRRVTCINTSAIYDLVLECAHDVGDFATRIFGSCCHNLLTKKGQSGQIFDDQRGYNVVVAFGNCKHERDSDRPGMGPPADPWGPNGECHSD